MAISGGSIVKGASAMTPTGGTAMTLTLDGVTIPNGIHVANALQTDFRIRENATFKNRSPVLAGDGTYGKGKQSVTLTLPKILASGKVVFNLVRIEIECHPESTVAENLDLRMLGAQLCSDTDFSSFWSSGSLA